MATVRRAEARDTKALAALHHECFPEDCRSLEEAQAWIEANHRAHPRCQYFVVVEGEALVGYILWMEKGGFRAEAVLELEQIGIAGSQRGKGLAKLLIRSSLTEVRAQLIRQRRSLKLVEVTTSTANEAQRLYRNTLGAEVEATIRDMYEGDEVIMVARHP